MVFGFWFLFPNLSQWEKTLSEEVKCLFSSRYGHCFNSFCAFKATLLRNGHTSNFQDLGGHLKKKKGKKKQGESG